MKSTWFAGGAEGQWSTDPVDRVDWEGDTIKVALLTSAYTPDDYTDSVWSDVNTHETSGANYTAGGSSVANKALTYRLGSPGLVMLDGDDVLWPNLTATFRWGVIYKDTGNDNTSPLLARVDFDSEQVVSDLTFAIVWDADGILTASVLP